MCFSIIKSRGTYNGTVFRLKSEKQPFLAGFLAGFYLSKGDFEYKMHWLAQKTPGAKILTF
jgi:hypothetical protein